METHLSSVDIINTKVYIPEIPELIRVSHTILTAVNSIGVKVPIGSLELEHVLVNIVSIVSRKLGMLVTAIPDIGITTTIYFITADCRLQTFK